MQDLLSIIVPLYNVENYLEQCIKSILKQSYKELEIILVDDGSTDSSGCLCDKYSHIDKRIQVIHKQNGGLISARYEGVKRAKAKYVTFVDGDDWIHYNMYERLMEIILREHVELVSSACIRYYDEMDYFISVDKYLREGKYQKEEIEQELIPKLLWYQKADGYALDPSLCTKIFLKDKLLEQYKKLHIYSFEQAEDSAVIYPMILNIDSLYITYEAYYYHRQRKRGIYAGRFLADDYFDGVYSLFIYLRDEFKKSQYSNILIEQLDFFYMKLIEYRKFKHTQVDGIKNTYLFPFDKVEKGKRIVLYGAGQVGKIYYKQIQTLNYAEVVLWVDKNYVNMKNKMVTGIKEIEKVKYDYIVVANYSYESSLKIRDSLINMGIDKDKIVLVEGTEINRKEL